MPRHIYMQGRTARLVAILFLVVAVTGCGDAANVKTKTVQIEESQIPKTSPALVKPLAPKIIRKQCDGPAITEAVSAVPVYFTYTGTSPSENGESMTVIGCRDLGNDGSLEALVELRGGGAKDVIFRWILLQRNKDATWNIVHEDLPVATKAPIKYSSLDSVSFSVKGDSIQENRSEYKAIDSSCCPSSRGEHELKWNDNRISERATTKLANDPVERCSDEYGGEPGDLQYKITNFAGASCNEAHALGSLLAVKMRDTSIERWSIDGFTCTITTFGPYKTTHSSDLVNCARKEDNVDLSVGA